LAIVPLRPAAQTSDFAGLAPAMLSHVIHKSAFLIVGAQNVEVFKAAK
jgi:hypothetical protein